MKPIVGRWRGTRCGLWVTAFALTLCLAWVAADLALPLPAPGRESPYAMVVLARDGTPLRAFPDGTYVWRYPVRLEDVSPLYVEAVVGYEDRTFWWHPGINPFSLARATYQWVSAGKIVSGGSTLTMQVAR